MWEKVMFLTEVSTSFITVGSITLSWESTSFQEAKEKLVLGSYVLLLQMP